VFFAGTGVNGISLAWQEEQVRQGAAGMPPAAPAGLTRSASLFKGLVCEEFHCPSEQYEAQLFRRSLHWHAVLVARLLSKFRPGFFFEDSSLIREIASAASHAEVLTELNRFYGRNLRDRNWLRKTFSLRISGKRILRLSRRLFHSA
jgi:hypothetical protein